MTSSVYAFAQPEGHGYPRLWSFANEEASRVRSEGTEVNRDHLHGRSAEAESIHLITRDPKKKNKTTNDKKDQKGKKKAQDEQKEPEKKTKAHKNMATRTKTNEKKKQETRLWGFGSDFWWQNADHVCGEVRVDLPSLGAALLPAHHSVSDCRGNLPC